MKAAPLDQCNQRRDDAYGIGIQLSLTMASKPQTLTPWIGVIKVISNLELRIDDGT
jgi:hypothetical protein